jgi:hypothetical protein
MIVLARDPTQREIVTHSRRLPAQSTGCGGPSTRMASSSMCWCKAYITAMTLPAASRQRSVLIHTIANVARPTMS